jgi:hypothetical protein
MKPSEILPSALTLVGHVKNGVIVVDGAVNLPEGQAVRIEPLAGESRAGTLSDGLSNQLQEMKALFAQWDEEDSLVPEETAEDFHRSLERHRGLHFRAPDGE